MIRINELSHTAGLGWEGAYGPEVRTELCLHGAGKRFRRAVRSKINLSAGSKHAPGVFIQHTALQDIRRAYRILIRINPEGISVAAFAVLQRQGQLRGTGISVMPDREPAGTQTGFVSPESFISAPVRLQTQGPS